MATTELENPYVRRVSAWKRIKRLLGIPAKVEEVQRFIYENYSVTITVCDTGDSFFGPAWGYRVCEGNTYGTHISPACHSQDAAIDGAKRYIDWIIEALAMFAEQERSQ